MFKFLCVFMFCLSTLVRADTLTLLNWEEYLSEEVVKAWEERSGHQLKQIYFDSDEQRDSILANHKDQVIDLAIVDAAAARLMGHDQLFLPIESYQDAPNVKTVELAHQVACGQYAVPYLWGTIGIVYRTDKVKVPPDSWNFILSPDDAMALHVGLLDDYVDTLIPALMLDGASISTDNQLALRKAFNRLKEALPKILTFEYSVSFLEDEEKGKELYAALAYSGDQYALNEKAGSEIWDYTTVKEGTVQWVDCMIVMNDSPRKALAMDFLNFIYDAPMAAKNSEQVYVATPISAAKKLQSEEFLNDATVYPPANIMEKTQHYETLSPDNILRRNRITSALIKLHESK